MRNNGKSIHTPLSQRPGGRRRSASCQPKIPGSSRTRIGKIARLPQKIREQLNRRLQDGEEGNKLVDWLNALPETKKVLARQFGRRPISKQNLSEWRQGGYRDWARAEEDRQRVDRLIERADQLAAPDGESPLSERLAAVLLVQLAGILEELQDASLPARERWDLLRQMLREVSQARREDHRAAKARIDQQRWEYESMKLEEEHQARDLAEMKKKILAPCTAARLLPVLEAAYGGGEMARKNAAFVLEIQHDLKLGSLTGDEEPSSPVKPGQGESGSTNRPDRADHSDESGTSTNKR